MTDPMIIAAAVVTVVGSVTAGVVTVLNAYMAAKDRQKVEAARQTAVTSADGITRKTDTLIEKTAEIHSLTNSNLAAVTAALQVANEKISGLEKMVAALGAQITATVAASAAAAAILAAPPKKGEAPPS